MDFASCSIATDNHREGLMPEYAPFDSATAPTPTAGKRHVGQLHRQYLDLKAEAADCVLVMRVGAFYELYGEDAERAGRILGIPVIRHGGAFARSRIPCRTGGTKRRHDGYLGQVSFGGRSLPLFAESVEDIEESINRFLRAGVSVAIAEQVESYADARRRQALVDRKVVRIYRPGLETTPDGGQGNADGDNLAEGASQPMAALWAQRCALTAEHDQAVQAVFKTEGEVEDLRSSHAADALPSTALALRLVSEEELAARHAQRLGEIEDAIMAMPSSALADLRIKAKVIDDISQIGEPSAAYVRALVRALLAFRP